MKAPELRSERQKGDVGGLDRVAAGRRNGQLRNLFPLITGQRLARYQYQYYEWEDAGVGHIGFYGGMADRTQHIGGQLTSWNGSGATTDRLGSIRAKDNGERYTYYPYGETHRIGVGRRHVRGSGDPAPKVRLKERPLRSSRPAGVGRRRDEVIREAGTVLRTSAEIR